MEPSSPVVLAVIDEKSLDVEGRWQSWPRSKFGELIDAVSKDGAKVIGFDIGFLEPDQNSYNNFINELDQKITALNIKNSRLKDFIKDNKLKADKDLILANSIKDSRATVILGYFFHLKDDESDYQIDEDEIEDEVLEEEQNDNETDEDFEIRLAESVFYEIEQKKEEILCEIQGVEYNGE